MIPAHHSLASYSLPEIEENQVKQEIPVNLSQFLYNSESELAIIDINNRTTGGFTWIPIYLHPKISSIEN